MERLIDVYSRVFILKSVMSFNKFLYEQKIFIVTKSSVSQVCKLIDRCLLKSKW